MAASGTTQVSRNGSTWGLILGLLLALGSAVVPVLDSSSLPSGQVEVPSASPPDAAEPPNADAAALLSQLVVAPEGPRQGYRREAFRHWLDADGDGCDTRQEVLIEESVVPASTEESRCRVVSGEWLSLYDALTLLVPGGLDIDHMVPLGEAWDSGASQWDSDRRRDYANDLDHPEALLAVSASSNRSKSDRDPAEWKPSNLDYWCQYAVDWLIVKVGWGLSADDEEVASLHELLATCGSE